MTVGEYTDGRRHRVSRRVHVPNAAAAARELAVFAAEAQAQAPVVSRDLRDLPWMRPSNSFSWGTPAQPVPRGPPPKGGLPLEEIGRRLGRSERWAGLAVQAAELHEAAGHQAVRLNFDGSVLALRKFTSSELLDAGFNISMVAQRQGHGPQVLIQHYSQWRRSADRRAAEHLGRVVHGKPSD